MTPKLQLLQRPILIQIKKAPPISCSINKAARCSLRSNEELKLEKMHARFSRRGVIRGAAVVAGGGAVFAGLGQGFASAQATKVAQSVAKYQTTPKAKAQCSNCSSFIAPSSCKVVAGSISPSGWCSLYSAKA